MVIAVQPCDIYNIASQVNIDVFSQHIDAIPYGAHTGWILPYAIKDAGAKGSLINHAEHQIKLKDISQAIDIATKINLEIIACASDVAISKAIACFQPTYVAIEPPELIGGDISVTTAEPDIIKDSVNVIQNIDSSIGVLCGAGIKTDKDVYKAIELGTCGILIASGIVKAKDKQKILERMSQSMIK